MGTLYSREATSQVAVFARIFGDCREGQIPRCLHRHKLDAPYACIGVFDFTRHGETIWNVENKICGATDIALTERGHEQAIALGKQLAAEKLPIDEILYSNCCSVNIIADWKVIQFRQVCQRCPCAVHIILIVQAVYLVPNVFFITYLLPPFEVLMDSVADCRIEGKKDIIFKI